jgi:hypothetical protein
MQMARRPRRCRFVVNRFHPDTMRFRGIHRLITRGQPRHQELPLIWTTFGGVTACVAVVDLTALLVTA